MKKLFYILIVGFLLSSSGSVFAKSIADTEAKKIKSFVSEIIDNMIKNVASSKTSKEEKVENFEKIFVSNIDTEFMNKFLLGRKIKKMESSQIDEFNRAFKEFNLYSWILKISLYTDEKVEIAGVKPAKKDSQAMVDVLIVPVDASAEKQSLQIRVRKLRGGEYKISDITVAGVSMLLNYRKEFKAIRGFAKDNDKDEIGYLISVIKDKTANMKKDYMK